MAAEENERERESKTEGGGLLELGRGERVDDTERGGARLPPPHSRAISLQVSIEQSPPLSL